MKKCERCDIIIEEGTAFCPNCGTSVEQEKKFDLTSNSGVNLQLTLEPLVARNFWLWYLLSLVTGGTLNLIYIYINFDDLKRLDQYPRQNGVPTPAFNMTNLLILIIISYFTGLGLFIMPYILYQKYNKLFEYINYSPKKPTTIPMSGKKFLCLYLLSFMCFVSGYILFFIAFISDVSDINLQVDFIILIVTAITLLLISVPLNIIILIKNWKWQEAYNELAYIICPGTIKKDLF